MVPGGFLWLFMALGWFFMVPGRLLWFQVGFSWFQVGFHGSRSVFHDSSLFFMFFHVSKLVYIRAERRRREVRR